VSATVPLWAEIAIAALALFGAGFALIGSWGLAKFGDFAKRLHGPTKATTLGVGCVLIASMLWFGLAGTPSLHELLITVFLFFTAPVSAHLLIKAAMRLDPSVQPPARPRHPQPDQTSSMSKP
jgi:multicomponent K+:H+ antiporter subunit G